MTGVRFSALKTAWWRMPSAHHCSAQVKGFTLIEILVALSISAIALTAVFGVFSQVSTVAGKIETQSTLGQAGRTIMLRLQTDLEALYRPSGSKKHFQTQALFSGAQPPEDLFEPHTALDFVSSASLRFEPHFPQHTINRISYILKPGAESNAPYQLLRQETAFASLPGEVRRKRTLTLSRIVAAFEIEFFREEDQMPLSAWNREALSPEDRIWPELLAVRLTLADSDTKMVFNSLIAFEKNPNNKSP
jgi:prepilin-type N-terminal cleavage/methylation domain-containing protein